MEQLLVKGNYTVRKYFDVVVNNADKAEAASQAEDMVLDTEAFEVEDFEIEEITEIKREKLA